MQWRLDGRPTWCLPRRLALIVFPLLSGVALLASILLSLMAPQALPQDQAAPFLVGMAALGVALFVFYLWLVMLWDRANP